MRKYLVLGLCCAASSSFAASDYPVKPIPFTEVRVTGGLLEARQATNTQVTMPFALQQCESSDRLKNFDLAAETMRRRAAGETNFQNKPVTVYPFDDSDVYKAIEGAAYCLSVESNNDVKKKVDGFIERVAAAQEPDGYLYTWRTMHPESPAHDWIDQQRWLKDPQLSHEIYNLGHLYEAGVAYEQATGSRALLDICLKSAELLYRDFGDGEPRIAPGHQVIEMGLAKLYRETGDQRWIDLAKFFIEARGHGGSDYSQDHRPVVDQTEAVGHAVRANYLYSGMADVAALTGDKRYFDAITKIWENVVSRKLHLTGGCGARAAGEAYGADYELPHRCYNETCAAVAFLFWNHRMFLMTGEGKYMDVFERSLYNGVLSGVSLSGDRFFYPNPLEYDGKAANNHGYAGRAPWFGCACCPPNVLRTIAELGGFAYATQGDNIFVNLYAESGSSVKLGDNSVQIEQSTRYPWDGSVNLKLNPQQSEEFTLSLRIPCWAQGQPLPSELYRYDEPTPALWRLRVNGEALSLQPKQGYVAVRRQWKAGDTVSLDFSMPVRRVAGNSQIAATKGQVALERGPIVYTFEGIDNEGSVFDIVVPTAATITPDYRADFLGGVTVLKLEAAGKAFREQTGAAVFRPKKLTAIPYAVWANRGLSPMAVWVARETTMARVAPLPSVASKAKVTTSFHRNGMEPGNVNDQLQPLNATDGFAPNFDFWPHKATSEWVAYEFAQPTQIKSVSVSWFDDTGTGECRLPAWWSLDYRNSAGEWMPVSNPSEFKIQKTQPVKLTFDPVTTTSLRLNVKLPEKFSAGLYEWSVE